MNRRHNDSALRGMVKVAGWLVVVVAVYLGWSSYWDGKARQDAAVEREQQSQDLACFADNTTKWEVAISDVIVQNLAAPKTPERQEALDNLVSLNQELQRSKSLCPRPGAPAIPPVAVTPGTTTTTSPP